MAVAVRAPLHNNTWLDPPWFSPLAFIEFGDHASVQARHSSTDAFCEAIPVYIWTAG